MALTIDATTSKVVEAQSSDPTASTNPVGGAGTVILNTTTGKIFTCTDASNNANVWTTVGPTPATADEITKQGSDPTISTNPAGGVGSIILNTTSGKMFVCTDATTGANEWIAGVDGAVSPSYDVDFLVIGGGGGGAGYHYTGGGGSGGYRNSFNGEMSGGGNTGGEAALSVTPSTYYLVTIGGGGAGGPNAYSGTQRGVNGDPSVFGSITSLGGGGGANYGTAGAAGGSGGGGIGAAGAGFDGGAGESNQGFAGGSGTDATPCGASGGGGGGAGGVGGSPCASKLGGVGLESSITGSAVPRGGGGGTGSETASGAGGSGGGGTQANGAVNTGGGGSGRQGSGVGFIGGSGVVILRMLTSNYSGTTTGTPTVSTSGSDTILIYNASGSYTG